MKMTLTEFAKRHNVTTMAISKAIAAGRLTSKCVTWDDKGKPSITDPDRADFEWEVGRRRGPATLRGGDEAELGQPGAVPPLATSIAIKEAAAARKEIARAEMAELDVKKRRGLVIPIEQAKRDMFDDYTIVRTRMLAVAALVGQRFPQHAAAVVPVIDGFIRDALEELAAS